MNKQTYMHTYVKYTYIGWQEHGILPAQVSLQARDTVRAIHASGIYVCMHACMYVPVRMCVHEQ